MKREFIFQNNFIYIIKIFSLGNVCIIYKYITNIYNIKIENSLD